MLTYRYDNRIQINAANYTDAKRQIEARFRGPINSFRLEVLSKGAFVPAC